MAMRVFTTRDFTGYYPVGTAAVVVERDEASAKKYLDEILRTKGLKFDGTLVEINIELSCVHILCDGNY